MVGPTFFRLLPNAEHTTALSGLTTKHYFFALRQMFFNVVTDTPMPEYCTERYTRTDGTKGVRFYSNEKIKVN